MPTTLVWLPTAIRVAIAPVLVGAMVLLVEPTRSLSDLAAAVGLVLLGAIHVVYWWRPWPSDQRRAFAAAAGMVLINFVLLNLIGLAQPLLWLYPRACRRRRHCSDRSGRRRAAGSTRKAGPPGPTRGSH
jgi:hypothetical protein